MIQIRHNFCGVNGAQLQMIPYHLDRNVQHCLQIKLAPALLEQVLETLAEQIHDHNVVHLAVFGLLVADKMQEGHEGLAAQFMDKFTLPEEHYMPLHFDSFLLQTDIEQLRVKLARNELDEAREIVD